jgi:hypothetical protein
MTDPAPPKLRNVLIGTLMLLTAGAAFGAIVAYIVS